MKMCRRRGLLAVVAAMVVFGCGFAVGQQPPPPDQTPANRPPMFDVTGKWNFYTHGEAGQTHTDPIELKQNGSQLTGHFKGPNQSGGLEGTVNGREIFFRTKTRHPVTFRGRIQDSNNMQGNSHVMGHAGTWEARRAE
jgi:hypothetical protein